MKKRTINEAILEVFKREGTPLQTRDIYNKIIEYDLYRFRAQKPEDIVRIQLRRHCEGLDFPTASSKKLFSIRSDGAFWKKESTTKANKSKIDESTLYDDLIDKHKKYLVEFKKNLLKQLKELSPSAFEEFGKELMKAYGFKKMEVTKKTRDGGLDGFGELKIGLASMKVAFECKRWSRNTVGIQQINQFRGSIQGKYQQGIYFTTSQYSKDAKNASFQSGAVPIILIDGNAIVELMIDKKFGVEVEEIPIYSNALDLVLTD